MAKHQRGDQNCAACRAGFPVPCDKEGCGGLVHAEPGCVIETDCDKCPPEPVIGKEESCSG